MVGGIAAVHSSAVELLEAEDSTALAVAEVAHSWVEAEAVDIVVAADSLEAAGHVLFYDLALASDGLHRLSMRSHLAADS